MEICEICGEEILVGTGDEFINAITDEIFWLCDDCIAEGDYY